MAYIKQNFVDRQTVLKAHHLDHIENGIIGNESRILKVQEHTDNLSSAIDNTLYMCQKIRGDVINIPENLHFSKNALLSSIETEAYEGDHILTATGSYIDIDGDIFSIPKNISSLPNYGYGAGEGYNNTVDLENGKYTQKCNVFEPANTDSHGEYTYFQGLTFNFPISRYDECVRAIETIKCSHSELTFSYHEVTKFEEDTISSGMLNVKFNGAYISAEDLEEFIGRQRASNQPVVVCYGLFDPIVTDIPKVDIELPVNPCSGVDFDGAVGEIDVFVPKTFVDSSFIGSKCANAIRGTLRGGSVSVDDVSPIEHELDIKVTDADGVPIEGTTVKRYGKNLFDNDVNKITQLTWKENDYEISRLGYGISLPVGEYQMHARRKSEAGQGKAYIYSRIIHKDNSVTNLGYAPVGGADTKDKTFYMIDGDILYLYKIGRAHV